MKDSKPMGIISSLSKFSVISVIYISFINDELPVTISLGIIA